MLSSKPADQTFATNALVKGKEPAGLGNQYPDLTETEADEGFATFAAHMFKFFPYVYVSPNTTSSELRTKRPFLLLCMAAISSKHADRQRELFGMMRETIAQKLVITIEPCIDLLLGLLTFLGW